MVQVQETRISQEIDGTIFAHREQVICENAHADVSQKVKSKVNRVAPMLSVQFRNSLAVLVERMNKCYPHFVRYMERDRSNIYICNIQ